MSRILKRLPFQVFELQTDGELLFLKNFLKKTERILKKATKSVGEKANLQTKILKFSTKSMAPGPNPHTKRPHTCSYYLFRVFLLRLMRLCLLLVLCSSPSPYSCSGSPTRVIIICFVFSCFVL